MRTVDRTHRILRWMVDFATTRTLRIDGTLVKDEDCDNHFVQITPGSNVWSSEYTALRIGWRCNDFYIELLSIEDSFASMSESCGFVHMYNLSITIGSQRTSVAAATFGDTTCLVRLNLPSNYDDMWESARVSFGADYTGIKYGARWLSLSVTDAPGLSTTSPTAEKSKGISMVAVISLGYICLVVVGQMLRCCGCKQKYIALWMIVGFLVAGWFIWQERKLLNRVALSAALAFELMLHPVVFFGKGMVQDARDFCETVVYCLHYLVVFYCASLVLTYTFISNFGMVQLLLLAIGAIATAVPISGGIRKFKKRVNVRARIQRDFRLFPRIHILCLAFIPVIFCGDWNSLHESEFIMFLLERQFMFWDAIFYILAAPPKILHVFICLCRGSCRSS